MTADPASRAGDLLVSTDRGFHCAAGGFTIDPWKPVDRAVVTHAHGDHARWGSRRYLAAREGERVLRARLGADAEIQFVDWGETLDLDGVRVSFHPAGHILGSAQVRLEHRGEVWVVSGDYKTEPDPTATPFAPLRADVFVTESTFGLPIYRWRPEREVIAEIVDWWRENREAGRVSVLFAWALGKAQRVLAGLAAAARERELPGAIHTHGAVERMTAEYRASGIELAPTAPVATDAADPARYRGALVLAPPSAGATPWIRRFQPRSTAFVSGWMRVRGARRRRSLDRGFALSDHADWPGLLAAIADTGAPRVLVTHGYRESLARWLSERGIEARAVASAWEGESASEESGGAEAEGAPASGREAAEAT